MVRPERKGCRGVEGRAELGLAGKSVGQCQSFAEEAESRWLGSAWILLLTPASHYGKEDAEVQGLLFKRNTSFLLFHMD